MLTINVEKLKEYREELTYLVNKYEENTMSIAQELTNTELNWHDDNSPAFFLTIANQKNKILEFLNNLKNNVTNYEKIIEEFKKIDLSIKDIFVNSKYKETILSLYNNCISSLNRIKKKFANLDYSFCTLSETNTIRNEKDRLEDLITSLTLSKEKVDKLFSQLINVENKIISIRSKMEMNRIDKLELERFIL